MMPISALAILFSAAATGQPSLAAPRGFALHDGDRVAFYGDSITENSAWSKEVETYVVTRFPNLQARYFNAGVGGDRVTGGWMGPIDLRLTRDLFSRKPTVITIMLGMNDAGYQPFNPGLFTTYENGFQHIADRIKREDPAARVWLFRPSPYDDVTRAPFFPGGYNSVLLRYSDYVNQLAQKEAFHVVDQNQPFVDLLTKARAMNATQAQTLIPDRIHPTWQADYVMAEDLIKAWGGPSLVARAEIDAATGTGTGDNCVLSNVSKSPSLTWTELDNSLPFPLDHKDALTQLVMKCSDFEQTVDQEPLIVRNLTSGNYDLKIDGKSVGTFSADALDSGVNLADVDTPMMAQAMTVSKLTNEKADLFYMKWRNIEFTMQDQPSRARERAISALDALTEDLVNRQHKAAQPVPHTFTLTKM